VCSLITASMQQLQCLNGYFNTYFTKSVSAASNHTHKWLMLCLPFISHKQDGVVPALVALGRVTDDVFFSSDGQDTAVRHNCASALRSLTCKAEIRTLLIEGGAISVILDDAQVTITPITVLLVVTLTVFAKFVGVVAVLVDQTIYSVLMHLTA
jgi:hypothetical protein